MKLRLSSYKASKDIRKKYNKVGAHFSKKGMQIVKVSAGSYFLGDPCYAVPRILWDDLLKSSRYFRVPIGKVEGHKVIAFDTGGDGTFYDQFWNEFPVDSGLIGLVPKALVDMAEFKQYRDVPGIWVKFDSDEFCETDGKILQFGKRIINLSSQPDDEDDEDEDDEYAVGDEDAEDDE